MPTKKVETDLSAEVGNRLGKALKEVGKKQIHLVTASGVDAPAVSRVLRGTRGVLSERLLAILVGASRLDISLEYVLCARLPIRRTQAVTEVDAMRRALSELLVEHGLPSKSDSGGGNESPAARHRRG